MHWLRSIRKIALFVVAGVVAGVPSFCMPAAASAATCTWAGGGGDALWSTAANWSGCTGPGIPQNGDDLVFPAGAARPANENNIAALGLTSIAINGIGAGDERYSISGAGVTLTGAAGLAFNAPDDGNGRGPQFFAPIALGTASSIANTGIANAAVSAIDTAGFTLSFNPSTADITATDAIAGAGGLAKIGSGRLVLSVANGYAGMTQIDAGVVVLQNASSLGAIGQGTTVTGSASIELPGLAFVAEPLVLNGGTIRFSGQNTLPGAIQLTADSAVEGTDMLDALALSGLVSGEFILTKNGPGTLRLQNAGETWGGGNTFGGMTRPLTINAGELETVSFTLRDDILVLVANGATWRLLGPDTIGNIGGAGSIQLGNNSLTLSGAFPSEWLGTVSAGTGGLIVGSELTLSSSGPVEGLRMYHGYLRLNSPSPQRLTFAYGGTVIVNAPSRSLGYLSGLEGNIELFSSTLRVGSGDYNSTIRDRGFGGSLIKYGTGTFSLGPNAQMLYSGATVIEEGALLLYNAQMTGAVQMVGGVLRGNGTIGPLTATAGEIDPGGLVPGTEIGVLRTGSMQLSAAARFTVDVAATSQFAYDSDRVIVTGSVDLGGATLNVIKRQTSQVPALITMIENDGADPVVGTFAGLPEGTLVVLIPQFPDSMRYRITYAGGDGNDVELVRLPTSPCVWTGAHATPVWSIAANWKNCDGAAPGLHDLDVIEFPAGAANPVNQNDIPNLWLVSVRITGTGAGDVRYDISGAPVELVNADLRFSAPADSLGRGPRFLAPIIRLGDMVVANEGPNAARATVGTISGGNALIFDSTTADIEVGAITSHFHELTKNGAAAVLLDPGNNYFAPTRINAGTLIVTGAQTGAMQVAGGLLGGTGSVGAVTATSGGINPGALATNGQAVAIGTLTSGAVTLSSGASLTIEMDGASHDRLNVTGTVSLGQASLVLAGTTSLDSLILIANDGSDPVVGTFEGLGEGELIPMGGALYEMSYAGGDGNDVTLTRATTLTYLLAEGATGSFFDYDLLIANPNLAAAPVTVTFFTRDGQTIVEQRTIAPQSRLTLQVDTIPGLEQTEASAQVVSEDALPLAVERTMFWDATSYGGHTAEAVRKASTQWYFAEGSQGFFQTYLLVVNPAATPADFTFTFLRENEPPVVKTLPIVGNGRLTLYAGDFPELTDRSFGVTVQSTEPIVVERAMYFASTPERLWLGGHGSLGVSSPSTHWFFAEGATGTFFDTYFLLANPSASAVDATVTFLGAAGETVTLTRTVPAQGRLTVDMDAELANLMPPGAVAATIDSPQPLIAERSMYWPGDASPWGEAHNSFGMTESGLRWGLAEGRLGGPRQMSTFILLANSEATAANVTVTFLRETGTPIARTYTVPPNSRFNVDVAADAPELNDSGFGADVRVTNGVPITVECSMYWNANGVFWAGGSNAPATRLP